MKEINLLLEVLWVLFIGMIGLAVVLFMSYIIFESLMLVCYRIRKFVDRFVE